MNKYDNCNSTDDQNNKINTDFKIYKFNKKITYSGIICIIVCCILIYFIYKLI